MTPERRDLCELFARVTLAVVFHHAVAIPDVAQDVASATPHEGGAECPRCPRFLRFEDDVLTGLVYEVCACGYVALISQTAALARYRADQQRLRRTCAPFKLPPQHRGIRRDVADAA